MLNSRKFLAADLTLQVILAAVALWNLPSVDGAFLLLPFGAWQVLSALFLLFFRKYKSRVLYLLTVLAWVGLTAYVKSEGAYYSDFLTSVVFVVPPVLGVLYLLLTGYDLRISNGDLQVE